MIPVFVAWMHSHSVHLRAYFHPRSSHSQWLKLALPFHSMPFVHWVQMRPIFPSTNPPFISIISFFTTSSQSKIRFIWKVMQLVQVSNIIKRITPVNFILKWDCPISWTMELNACYCHPPHLQHAFLHSVQYKIRWAREKGHMPQSLALRAKHEDAWRKKIADKCISVSLIIH